MRHYRTIQGDTWDIIAARTWPDLGGELLTSKLIAQNPDYIDTVIFPAGIILDIPDIETPAVKNLPPWVD